MSDGSEHGRDLRPDDVEGVAELFGTVFGRRLSAAQYRWKLLGRPAPARNVALAVDGEDRPVFHLGGIPCRAWIAGEERHVMVAVDAMTAPGWRRRGLLTRHASALFAAWREAGVALVLGMPNEGYGSRAAALGWRPLGELAWLVCPLRPERTIARKLGLPWAARLTFVGGAWRRVIGVGIARAVPGGPAAYEVREVAGALDPRFDELWARARPAGGQSLVRDRAWVTWRYLDDPARRYRVLEARRGGGLAGYLACNVADVRSLVIAEALPMPGDAGVLAALVAEAIARYAAGAESVRALAVPGSWLDRGLRGLGFFGRGPRFRVEYIPLDPSLEARGVGVGARWHLGGGDFDVV